MSEYSLRRSDERLQVTRPQLSKIVLRRLPPTWCERPSLAATPLALALLAGCAGAPRPTPLGPRTAPLVVERTVAPRPPLRITRVVHASVLIECDGATLLTDPWFTQTAHYPPREALGVPPDSMSPLSAVVSTMNHYDHFDLDALAPGMVGQAPVVVPAGTRQAERARSRGFAVRALSPGDSTRAGPFLITGVAARPTNATATAFDYEQAWRIDACGWRVLVVGHRLTEAQARAAGPVDIALLPVNALRIKPLFKRLSLSPPEAAAVAFAASAPLAVPMHYRYRSTWLWERLVVAHPGTAEAFAEAARARGVTSLVVTPGQTIELRAR